MRRTAPPLLVLLLTAAALAGAVVLGSAGSTQQPTPTNAQWYRGNLHTHSLWSDGDDYPEMIVAWFKDHGYDFLALTDHNVLSEGRRWIDAARRGGREALAKYKGRFGSEWVEEEEVEGKQMVRLKPLAEFRHLFEETGKFLMIQGEEITDSFRDSSGNAYPVHLNATNLRDLIPPQHGASVSQTIQNNVTAVEQQRESAGQPMIVHLNHPNFGWGVTAEDLLPIKGGRFFEVFNGHRGVRNYGDDQHASTERIWDIVLSFRLAAEDGELLYAVATDDSHNYHEYPGVSNPGRGWIMVRAGQLTPESIVKAMQAGDFYASSGVRLSDIRFDGKKLEIDIDGQEGATYHTQFIGTRKGFDQTSKPAVGENGQQLHITRTYSDEIGAVFGESDSLQPSYTLTGDELYVRARVTSSKPHPNPFAAGDTEMAWTQPVRPEE
jgi:hypothetical protein